MPWRGRRVALSWGSRGGGPPGRVGRGFGDQLGGIGRVVSRSLVLGAAGVEAYQDALQTRLGACVTPVGQRGQLGRISDQLRVTACTRLVPPSQLPGVEPGAIDDAVWVFSVDPESCS